MKVGNHGIKVWRTVDEKDYIDNLGRNSVHTMRDRKKLLEKYIRAAKLRHNWDGVNKKAVLEYARKKWAEI